MALMQKGVALAAGRMPKTISPRVHAALDYAIAGSFALMGALFWKRNRRAAVGSLLCGGATAALSLLTDYPGGVAKVIPYSLHGQIDGGLIAMTASIPSVMHIQNKREARFFSRQALAKTAITAMTDFERDGRRRSRQEREEQPLGI
jgi:hypothetical protein